MFRFGFTFLKFYYVHFAAFVIIRIYIWVIFCQYDFTLARFFYLNILLTFESWKFDFNWKKEFITFIWWKNYFIFLFCWPNRMFLIKWLKTCYKQCIIILEILLFSKLVFNGFRSMELKYPDNKVNKHGYNSIHFASKRLGKCMQDIMTTNCYIITLKQVVLHF